MNQMNMLKKPMISQVITYIGGSCTEAGVFSAEEKFGF